MAKDLTIVLEDRPGTLAEASEALGNAGVNIDGACGFPSDGVGIFHVLVEDTDAARRALTEAGFEIRAEREVVIVPVEDRPGEGGRILRRVADAGANVDLVYITMDGRLVMSGGDVEAIRLGVA